MHVWRQSLLIDNFPAQRRELSPLFFGQRGEEIGFVFGCDLGKLFQCSIAFCGEHELRMTSIFRAPFSFNQSFGSEFVDQNNHSAWKEAEFFRQPKLITAGIVGDEPEDAGMRTAESKWSDSSPESRGGVSSELGKEKRGARVPSCARPHILKIKSKKSFASTIIHYMNDS
jgi:hypothetical protein